MSFGLRYFASELAPGIPKLGAGIRYSVGDLRHFATLVVSAIWACSVLRGAGGPSSIVLPIEFDLSGFVSDAERDIPLRLKSDWEAVGKTVKMPVAYRFDLERSPLEVTGNGDRVLVSTKVRYKVDVGVPGPTPGSLVGWRRVNGCQPRKSVTVSLDTRVEFTPDWQLRGRSQPRLEMPEPCRLSAARELVNVDISEKVRLAFLDGLSKAARDFDQRLASQVVLRDLAARAWASLAEPMAVGERTWLRLNPSRVLVMRPVAVGRMVRTGVIVDGDPSVMTEPPGEPGEAPLLPALELTDPREGFALNWSTAMSWAELSSHLQNLLYGEQIKVSGRRTVRIEGVDLRPDGDFVLVTADLTGGVRGRIQLAGRPRFDHSAKTLEFADLDFTLETKSFLVRVADWFRHDGTRKKLSALARVDVTKWLERSRGRLELALRERFGEDLRLEGAWTVSEPSDLSFDADSVRLTARLEGALTLRWRK